MFFFRFIVLGQEFLDISLTVLLEGLVDVLQVWVLQFSSEDLSLEVGHDISVALLQVLLRNDYKDFSWLGLRVIFCWNKMRKAVVCKVGEVFINDVTIFLKEEFFLAKRVRDQVAESRT